MQKKQVAIIDIGSSSIRAVVGERGINKTFIIKASYSYEYDGYENGTFFDADKLKQALLVAGESLMKASRGMLDTVYVGAPGEFTQVVVKESQISFSKKKKIQESDVDALYEAAFVLSSSKFTLINRSAIVYELDDFRRLANPVGAVSEILKGKLSFTVCSNYFIEAVTPALKTSGFKFVECVSSTLAQALYLVEPETRDRIALLVDVGYISTTLTIIHGDGIVFQKTFAFGGGYITASLCEKFNLEFNDAEKLKRNVSLSKRVSSESFDLLECDNGQYYSVKDVQDNVIKTLDILCENVSDCLENSGFVIPDYVSLKITGGGITYIRGAKEHVSGRLGMNVEVVAPRVPLMNKPTESTILSLLDLALEQN